MPEISEAQLEEALSDARHALSNPLTVISGNAQLLLELVEMMDLGDEVTAPLEDIYEASDEVRRLIGEVYTAETLLE